MLLILSLPAISRASLPASEYQAVSGDSAFMDMVQKACFDFFWNEVNSSNGLIKDRDTQYSDCSIASVGFGLSAICVGADHGWVTRTAAADRVLTTLNTFWKKPQGREAQGYIGYKGFFYHFLNMSTALRSGTTELSSIDTALLLAGILHCKQYFDQDDQDENRIRELADSIYYRVDWEWMRNYNTNISMEWSPEHGFRNVWIGYNEAMIMCILGLGSPTHPNPATIWKAWTGGYDWETHYGYTYIRFAPLFGHQYSHCWIDFRNIQDEYTRAKDITYFENSRRATLAQREYCIANPENFTGYGENIWGLTACDGPNGYKARGAPPAENDDGTIAPTAAGGSIVFTPEQSLAALHYMYDIYKSKIWKKYGFRDAFNLGQNWWDTDVIGIDEGPIILMMENYRTGSIWKAFMQNEDIKRGLQRAGFTEISSLNPDEPGTPKLFNLRQNYPNPFNSKTMICFEIPQAGEVGLRLFDSRGCQIAVLLDEMRPAGEQQVLFDASGLASAVYYYHLQTKAVSLTRKMLVIK
jgi:hypothetical protein